MLVVVTDGRSQDDVKKSAEKLQHSGMCGNINHYCVFWSAMYVQYILYVAELFQIIQIPVCSQTLISFRRAKVDLINS